MGQIHGRDTPGDSPLPRDIPVIEDSYFGSCNTAVAMRLHELYYIGNVKIGHWGFSKSYLK